MNKLPHGENYNLTCWTKEVLLLLVIHICISTIGNKKNSFSRIETMIIRIQSRVTLFTKHFTLHVIFSSSISYCFPSNANGKQKASPILASIHHSQEVYFIIFYFSGCIHPRHFSSSLEELRILKIENVTVTVQINYKINYNNLMLLYNSISSTVMDCWTSYFNLLTNLKLY